MWGWSKWLGALAPWPSVSGSSPGNGKNPRWRRKAPSRTSTSWVGLVRFLVIKPGEPVGFTQKKERYHKENIMKNVWHFLFKTLYLRKSYLCHDEVYLCHLDQIWFHVPKACKWIRNVRSILAYCIPISWNHHSMYQMWHKSMTILYLCDLIESFMHCALSHFYNSFIWWIINPYCIDVYIHIFLQWEYKKCPGGSLLYTPQA